MVHHEGVKFLTIMILFSTVSAHSRIELSISLLCKIWGPNLTCIHTSRSRIHFEEPHVSVQPVGQVIFLYLLFDVEIASSQWM